MTREFFVEHCQCIQQTFTFEMRGDKINIKWVFLIIFIGIFMIILLMNQSINV